MESEPERMLIQGDGPIPCPWLFLGEAPGAMEEKMGLPFIGSAGEVLWELSARAGLSRPQVYVDNVYPYRPPGNRTPTPAEVRSQRERLQGLLALVNPTYVVLLGSTAINAMLPGVTLKTHHGLPVVRDGRVFIVMYHPAARLHNPNLASVMEADWDSMMTRAVWAAATGNEMPPWSLDTTTEAVWARTLALDTETRPDGSLICFSTYDGERAVVYTGPMRLIDVDTLVLHNAKFDLNVLRRAGITVKYRHLVDTMIDAWVAGEESLGLKSLAARHAGMQMQPLMELVKAEQRRRNGAWLGRVPVGAMGKGDADRAIKWLCEPLSINQRTKLYTRLAEERGPLPVVGVEDVPSLHEYNARDSVATLRIAAPLARAVAGQERIRDIEMGALPALAEMEYRGVALDVGWLATHGDNLRLRQREAMAVFPSGINPNSGSQIAAWLFANHKPTKRTKGNAPSTDKEALTTLGTHEAKQVLNYRHITDQLEVVESLYEMSCSNPDGRIRTEFQQVRVHDTTEDAEGATATGRLSSRNPNLQNITHELRRAFVASPGHKLVSADYSQIEPRLMAYYAREERMADGFRNGISPYITVGKEVFKVDISRDSSHYKLAKILVLGTNYRLTPYGFSTRAGIGIGEATDIIHRYLDAFPGIQRYMDECRQQLISQGYVETFHGKRRYLPWEGSDQERDRAWRQAVNMPIQGTAAEVMKIALREVVALFPVLTVHDEIVADVPEALTIDVARGIVSAMERAWPTAIGEFCPIEVHATVGDNWRDMVELKL